MAVTFIRYCHPSLCGLGCRGPVPLQDVVSGELQPLLKQVSEQTLQIAVAAFAVCVLSAPRAVTSY